MLLNRFKNSQTLDSIISLYNNKLPFVVAEYICLIFRGSIVSNADIKYKTLFYNFIEHKEHIRYIFNKTLTADGDKSEYYFTKLTGVEINIPIGMDFEFMEKYSNLIAHTNSDIAWFDDDELPSHINESKYMGVCVLTF